MKFFYRVCTLSYLIFPENEILNENWMCLFKKEPVDEDEDVDVEEEERMEPQISTQWCGIHIKLVCAWWGIL